MSNFENLWERHHRHLTPARRDKMLAVSSQRTDKVRLVIQDTRHPHNVSACLRSAEAFGVQHVDIVNLKETFNPSSVTRGVQGWLSIKLHSSVEACVKDLKEQGYALAAGFPRPDTLPLADLPTERPIALIFGNEHDGVHESWVPHLDYAFSIPMVGFVESLNISVSCAISLYELTRKFRASYGQDYPLSPAAQISLLGSWVDAQLNLSDRT